MEQHGVPRSTTSEPKSVRCRGESLAPAAHIWRRRCHREPAWHFVVRGYAGEIEIDFPSFILLCNYYLLTLLVHPFLFFTLPNLSLLLLLDASHKSSRHTNGHQILVTRLLFLSLSSFSGSHRRTVPVSSRCFVPASGVRADRQPQCSNHGAWHLA